MCIRDRAPAARAGSRPQARVASASAQPVGSPAAVFQLGKGGRAVGWPEEDRPSVPTEVAQRRDDSADLPGPALDQLVVVGYLLV
eukprot:1941606-Alexandrium_andersonii.AAC.1